MADCPRCNERYLLAMAHVPQRDYRDLEQQALVNQIEEIQKRKLANKV
jgi:hypothetical protein